MTFAEMGWNAAQSAEPIREDLMLYWAFVFLVVGILAAVLGFSAIAGASFAIAKFLAGLFLLLFVIFLVLAVMGARKVV